MPQLDMPAQTQLQPGLLLAALMRNNNITSESFLLVQLLVMLRQTGGETVALDEELNEITFAFLLENMKETVNKKECYREFVQKLVAALSKFLDQVENAKKEESWKKVLETIQEQNQQVQAQMQAQQLMNSQPQSWEQFTAKLRLVQDCYKELLSDGDGVLDRLAEEIARELENEVKNNSNNASQDTPEENQTEEKHALLKNMVKMVVIGDPIPNWSATETTAQIPGSGYTPSFTAIMKQIGQMQNACNAFRASIENRVQEKLKDPVDPNLAKLAEKRSALLKAREDLFNFVSQMKAAPEPAAPKPGP